VRIDGLAARGHGLSAVAAPDAPGGDGTGAGAG
jgi:hypothetical protein